MKIVVTCLLALLFAWSVAAQKADGDASVFAEIEKISADLEEITGLHFSKKVPAAIINKEQLHAFLNDRIDQSIKPADMRAEELTLKMLGLLPEDFDLRSETVELLTEQAAAFYDYHKKKLFILAGETGGGQKIALVHELAHALADQNFHLEKYIKENGLNDDSATARMAVMEGQATWLMTAYMQKSMGGKSEVPEAVLDLMKRTVEMGATQFEVFSKAPPYLRESLLFPYTAGIMFQDAVFRKAGKDAFREVFERAPVSTHQVLHAETYIAKSDPSPTSAPRVPAEKHYRKLAEGTLGEFDFRVLLQMALDKEPAEALAAHLLGSRYVLTETKTAGRTPLIAVISTWDSPDSAKEFFKTYRNVIEKKSRSFALDAPVADQVMTGHDDAGYFRVTLNGTTVESTEGTVRPPA